MMWVHWDGATVRVVMQLGVLLINIIIYSSKTLQVKGKYHIRCRVYGQGPHFTHQIVYIGCYLRKIGTR